MTPPSAVHLGIAVFLSLSLAGCRRPELDVDYGVLSGPSINGVRVFAEVLKSAGHKVRRARTLTPTLLDTEEIGTLVFVLRQPGPIDADVVAKLTEWLE
ncbi:MAG: hypothetical protein ACRDD1_13900, partial [Planctomycetia bacterium]